MEAKFSDLLGKTLESIAVLNGDDEEHEILFDTTDGERYKLFKENDGGWSIVQIEDIEGDLLDLIGSTILIAEEIIDSGDSFTWTFYKLATIKGYVTIRWYGYSNGHYSESVDFCKIQ